MTANETLLNLRLIAALAEKTALKVEKRQAWPGEIAEAVAQMLVLLTEIKE